MAGCTQCASDTPNPAATTDPVFKRVLWAALLANAVMFGVELVAALLSDSVSLAADALDFFGDAAGYGVTLFVLGLGAVAKARAALFKSATMAAFGLWVMGLAVYRLWAGTVPEADIMGTVAVLALAVNVSVAIMLFRYRGGDSNRRSIWLCSRNDAIANIAVLLAAGGVFATGAGWPDILVAALITTLNLSAAWQVLRQARGELERIATAA